MSLPKKIPHIIKKHDDEIIDYYYWMRNINDPDVMALIEHENSHTNEISRSFHELQNRIFLELLEMIDQTEISLPFRYGNYYYFYKNLKGKKFKIYYRLGISSSEGSEEMILDLNEIAKDYNYFKIGCIDFEREGNYLLFNYDTDGFENYKLFLKDLRTNEIKFISERTFYSAVFFKNALFYTITTSETLRPYQVVKLDLKTFQKEVIFEEKDNAFEVYINKSKDGEILFIYSASLDTTETLYLRDLSTKPLSLFSKKKGIRYYAEHNGNEFYILTNEEHKNFKILRTDENLVKFDTLIPASEDKFLEEIEMFKNFLVIYERNLKDATKKVRIYDLLKNEEHYIDFNEIYEISSKDNYEFDSHFVRLEVENLTTPKTIYDYYPQERKIVFRKMDEINHFNYENYKTERIFVNDIPITIAYKKNSIKKDGSNYLWATGYGAYGIPIPITFRPQIITLLDKGFIYAIVHVRGGGEKGELWHQEGKLLKKKNTIYDFIKACEYLIENHWTSKGKIIIEGASAGGILLGGAINEKPDLFFLAIANVPFVDVLNTSLDPTLPFTILEYDEWGNPEISQFYYYIKSYCPYQNIKEQNYPHVLAICGFNDPRVRYWEPLKWISKLREFNKSNSIIALKMELNAGHFVGQDKYRILMEYAFIYAFALYLIENHQLHN